MIFEENPILPYSVHILAKYWAKYQAEMAIDIFPLGYSINFVSNLGKKHF